MKPVGFQQDRVVGDAIASVKVFSKRFADEMIIIDIDATKNGYRDLTLIKKLYIHVEIQTYLFQQDQR